MTTTTDTPRRPARLDRETAMRLAPTEYQRVVDLLRSLSPDAWHKPTECPGWDVRAMAGHMLGMVELAASPDEAGRQFAIAAQRGGLMIDALTALQVEEHADLSDDELIARFEAGAPRAAAARAAVPEDARASTLPHPELIGGVEEWWAVAYLQDVIFTRDPWMHRIDITRATGAELVHTPDHDGVIVDDVVHEWAGRHTRPVHLTLTGPAGGEWRFGTDGPSVTYDAVEFCRLISGRGERDVPFATEVPF
jgi:uncharacterized protein (TIGR03083 family)